MTQTTSFPVQWESPSDENLFWTWDQVHSPTPMSPLGASATKNFISVGMTEGARQLGMPFSMRAACFNGYMYMALLPNPEANDPARARASALQLRQQWDAVYLPELGRDLAYLKNKDLAALSNAELLAHLHEVMALARRHWTIHFLTVFPVFGAGSALSGIYTKIFGGDQPEDAPYRLLQGFDNKTLEGNRALRRLAESARAVPPVAALISQHAPALPREQLAATAAGPAFLAAFDAFMDEWGYRASALDDLADAPWIEEPSFVVARLRDYLSEPPADPEAQLREQAAERERLVADTLAAITDPAQRAEFEGILRVAQANWPLRETHSYYIDQMSLALVRRVFVEAGRRLVAAGYMDTAHDVFYLTLDEIIAALGATALANASEEIARRRQEHEAQRQLQPPPFVGTPPPADAPGPDPELAKFFGRPPAAPPTPTTITGAAASRGVVTGPARIVLSPSEFHRVKPGDILVCQTTTPPWTPLFSVIAGLVTDTGGVLSHGAIVAREYKLPAVVGAHVATRTIHDGQRITVDGAAGTVTLHE